MTYPALRIQLELLLQQADKLTPRQRAAILANFKAARR